MHTVLRLPLVIAGMFSLTNFGFSQLPYVETASLTILANFTATGVDSSTITPPTATPSDNPNSVNPIDRITTEIGTLILNSDGNGDQAFFVKQFQRQVLENYAEQIRLYYDEIAALDKVRTATGPADLNTEIDTLQNRLAVLQSALELFQRDRYRSWLDEYQIERDIAYIQGRIPILEFALEKAAAVPALTSDDWKNLKASILTLISPLESKVVFLKSVLGGKWELTAVRAPQSSVNGACSTPYKIFLTVLDGVNVGRPGLTYDTGVTLEPMQTAGNTTETLSDGTVTKASGSASTYFRFDFTFVYTADPLSNKVDGKGTSLAGLIPGTTYATSGDFWRYGSSGYMTYSLRSTPGPVAAVTQTKMNITGNGWWLHQTFDITFNHIGKAGISPMRIKMGATKYQNGIIFPSVTGD